MSEEGLPKLYANKPTKAQIKQFQEQHKAGDASSSASSSMASASSSSPPPPQPPKESFARRYKFLWPMLLTVNLAVGVHTILWRLDRKKPKDVPRDGVEHGQTMGCD
ncbi:uncharacterized protein E5676_scaffold347G00840 [Cucumis melo var. makuwa]|uniref:Uncharacterized protein n=1 Tax=Cucumis melo var. makuwa TaxID=1194695 RepID=A0A5A7UZ16_CUCMM|nr:uncharacterized protein E6C27_scaffold242G001640 [Cucumis melo var. makuwa]TYK03889.1 uncharacterized protein E5676_scaffold347G00840 [Cucumis melo var. makuwa]